MAKLQITCATDGAEIRYTVDGSDPTLQSDLYTAPIEASGTVKAKAWKEGMLSSEVSTYSPPLPPAVGVKLADGSTICYDRGEQYGTYAIEGGDLVKKDEGSDWRYIVCEEYDLNHYETGLGTGGINETYSGKQWGIKGQDDSGANETAIGTGKANTDYLIGIYNSDTYLWYYVNQHRTNTGKLWCVPSKDEVDILYENLTQIGNFSVSIQPWYWSSSEQSSNTVCCRFFSSGERNYNYKNGTSYRVRCIRYV